MIGTIVSWFETRNFGFIRPDLPIVGESVEIFIHGSDAPDQKPLPKDTRVSFECGKFGGKTKAINVAIIGRVIARQTSGDSGTAR